MKSALLAAAVLGLLLTGCSPAHHAAATPTPSPASAPAKVHNTAIEPTSRAADRHQAILEASRTNRYDVVFLGDSITQGFDRKIWQENFAPLKAGNFGVSGDRTEHLLWRITEGRELKGQNPRLFVLMVGVNNLWGKRNDAQQVSEGIALIVKTLRKNYPQAKILLLGVLPTQEAPTDPIRQTIKDINKSVATLADGSHARFLDFGDKMLEPDGTISKEIMPDFLHPNAKGYEIFVANIKPVMMEMLAGK